MIGIYIITNKKNGNSYIGQSVDIQRRFAEHRSPSRYIKGDTTLNRAFRKYGRDNFDYKVLELVDRGNVDKLNELEIKYIKELKPVYNRSAGGVGSKGHFVDDETKELLRQIAKEQWNEKSDKEKQKIIKNNLTGPKVGKITTQETRDKISKTLMGHVQSKETKQKRSNAWKKKKEQGWVRNGSPYFKKVRIVETGEVFESVKATAKRVGVSPSTISSCLNKRQKTSKGYTFEYVV